MTTLTPTSTLRSHSRLFINGQWVTPSSEAVIASISPVTEEVIATVPDGQPADIDRAVAAAREAFDSGPWPRMSGAERSAAIRRVRDEIVRRADELQAAFTAEIGAPIAVSEQFHQFALAMLDDAASLHERFTFEEHREWDGGAGIVVREPVGVVGTIIPWNGPVGTASLKVGPALAAGCTVVLKPAPEGAATMMVMAEAFAAAGLPPGVINIVPAGRETGEYLVTHPDVDKIAFTGSTAAGRRIMSLCGERIARVTLELGGKSAAIIADDVDLADVLPVLVPAGVGHSGQVCAALTRVLVPRERHDEVVAAMVQVFESLPVGDPRDPSTVLGPLAAERQRDRVESYFQIAREEGATIATGGERPKGLEKGWYVTPTLFANATSDMRVAQEEIFGPVVTVIPFDDIDDAVRIANDSQYGLSGAVFAKNTELGEQIARRIRSGQVSVNSWSMCFTQPFGGFKQSGVGREGNVEGLAAYLETKLIQVVS